MASARSESAGLLKFSKTRCPPEPTSAASSSASVEVEPATVYLRGE